MEAITIQQKIVRIIFSCLILIFLAWLGFKAIKENNIPLLIFSFVLAGYYISFIICTLEQPIKGASWCEVNNQVCVTKIKLLSNSNDFDSVDECYNCLRNYKTKQKVIS
jgi:hypothetical protein